MEQARVCEGCGEAFVGGLPQKRWCTPKCYQRSYKRNPEANRCTVEDCGRHANGARRLCKSHYRQFYNGEPFRPIRHCNRGQGFQRRDGYKLFYLPDHPNAQANGLVLEHRLVMSEILGRPLLPGENVHHINSVRDDNRPENLELWISSHPAGSRTEDIVEHAAEMLRRYAPDRLAS